MFPGGVAKRSVYFEALAPHRRTINIEIGGKGLLTRSRAPQKKRSVFFGRPGISHSMRSLFVSFHQGIDHRLVRCIVEQIGGAHALCDLGSASSKPWIGTLLVGAAAAI